MSRSAMEIFPQPTDGFDELPDHPVHLSTIAGLADVPDPVSAVRETVRPTIL